MVKMKEKEGKINAKILGIIVAITVIVGIVLCVGGKSKIKLNNATISHDEKFGGVYIDSSIEDFNNLGFQFGDSVDAIFSNGYKINDIPYYNGYYVKAGKPLLIGYPGTEKIKLGINYGDDLCQLRTTLFDVT